MLPEARGARRAVALPNKTPCARVRHIRRARARYLHYPRAWQSMDTRGRCEDLHVTLGTPVVSRFSDICITGTL